MSGLIKGVSILLQESHWKKWLQASARVIKEEGTSCGDILACGVDTEVLMASYVKDNTSQDKS